MAEIKCPFCQKPFSTEMGRKIHVRKTHKNGGGGKNPGSIKKPK